MGVVLIKGKPDKLIQHLIEDRDTAVDPHFVEDFLLTYRVFIHDPTQIFEKLMLWFADSIYRDKVRERVKEEREMAGGSHCVVVGEQPLQRLRNQR